MKGKYLTLNGAIVPYSEATIHVSSVAMKYGASVFEGIRGYWNEQEQIMYLFALQNHLARLLDSMKLMGMEHDWTLGRLEEEVVKIVKVNNLQQDCYIRLSASIDVDGPIDSTGPILLNIAAFSQGRKVNHGEGIRCAVSAWTRISDNMMPPRIKCVANYQNGRLAMLQAKSDGYDNVLMMGANGKISEAPTAAFFLVKNGQLITPSVTAGILESITRRCIIGWAREMDIEVVEREVDRSECYLGDEAFLCGTGAEISPIALIERYPIGKGPRPITEKLIVRYFDAVYGRSQADHHFLHPITREEIENASFDL